MSKDNNTQTPDWIDTPPEPGTYRSIFKWGAPDGFQHPNSGFLSVVKDALGLNDAHFKEKRETGQEPVAHDMPSALTGEDVAALAAIVGEENISFSDYARLKYSTGKAMEDILKLRAHTAENLPDGVVHPRDKADVQKIVAFCHEKQIPVYIYGGGSSVTLGLECSRGGVTLVMNTHMNRMLAFNETNQTITVEPGMMGPAYEYLLNNAPEKLSAVGRYTGGHFPQSFEYSSVGGWVVTLGAGQASSYYGDAYDLVISQEYVTPVGTFKTLDYPGTATGPKVNDIMKGSEGCFGVLVAVTMKIFRFRPENRQQFAFMFPDWESGVNAVREISQGQFGMPSVMRISDPEETDLGLKMHGIAGTPMDRLMMFKGLKPGSRCLFIGQADGEKGFARNVKKNVKRIARHYGGMYLTGQPVKKWEHGRFSDPYMREDLNDFGVLIDTLESSVTWDNLHRLHQGVRAYIKQHSPTICMTHASHFYPQGTNLYFIFLTPMTDLEEFRGFQRGIIDEIVRHGGSLSHHHGVGKMMGPWMERHLGGEQVAILRAIKQHMDPRNIMNPGGTLGLDDM
ncbi:MAG: FAD-binding oxidoreductase [Thermodesulfobacteriota bacterium]|nr:FAD-binding oxidoreductase [Thermodesulfobacteriota bacterium]